MKVAINAITELIPKYGSRVYLIELARALCKVEGIELLLLVGRKQKLLLPEELQPKVREVAVPTSRSYWQLFYQKRIRDLLLRESVDIYHLPNTLPLFWKPGPTVVSIHDLADLRVRKYGLIRTGYRWLLNYVSAKLADHVFTLSENSKNDLLKSLSISTEKVTVTYAGVDRRFRVRDRAECKDRIRNSHGIKSEFLLAPGGLSTNKNLGNLLLAFAELRKSRVELLLVLTGHGDKKENHWVRCQIKALELGDSVVLTGHLDPDEMPFFYGAASVVIYPSLYEGFGLPIVESMASGTALVVASTSSLPEIAGDAALFADPHDPAAIARAVRRLLYDEALRNALISRGLDRVCLFTWQKTAEKIVEVYQKVSNRKERTVRLLDRLRPVTKGEPPR